MGDVVAGKGGTVVAVFQMAGDLGLVLGPVVTGLGGRRRRVLAGLRPVRRGVRAAGVRRPGRARDALRDESAGRPSTVEGRRPRRHLTR